MPTMTVEQALAKVKDLDIAWLQETWIDDAQDPTGACLMGALAIACKNGQFFETVSDRMAAEMTLCRENEDHFRDFWGDSVDAIVDYRIRSEHQKAYGKWPTLLELDSTVNIRFRDLTQQDLESFSSAIFDEYSYGEDVDDTSKIVEEAIGREAFDKLSFIPNFNDGDLFGHLGQLYADAHGPEGCVFQSGLFYNSGDTDRSEIPSTPDLDLYTEFANHRAEGEIWDDIVTVLRHEYPSVLGMEICTDENCKDC